MVSFRQLALDLYPARPVQGGDSPRVKTIGDVFEENQCRRCIHGPVYCYTHTRFSVGLKCYGFKSRPTTGQHRANTGPTAKDPTPIGNRGQGLTTALQGKKIPAQDSTA